MTKIIASALFTALLNFLYRVLRKELPHLKAYLAQKKKIKLLEAELEKAKEKLAAIGEKIPEGDLPKD